MNINFDGKLLPYEYYASNNLLLFNMDCLQALQYIPNNSIDCVITDAPHRKLKRGAKIRKEQTKYTSGMVSKRGKQLLKYDAIRYDEWLPIIYSKMKDNSHMYLFVSGSNICELQTVAENVGFKYQQLIVNDKGYSIASQYYMSSVEFILLLSKGTRIINNCSSKNLLYYNGVRGYKRHPEERSRHLIKEFVKNSIDAGDVVLDLFMR